MARTWNENGKLLISVEDNGIGIKKEYLKRCSTVSSASTANVDDVKGFGLGPAYVRKLLRTTKVSIQSESGNGNIGIKIYYCFTFYKS